ncbi:hypothetical protein MXB_887 [Myxobolus squamalis]|nr:hypothetical protein MXB_887 [Myxobolus squamalis]
MKRVIVDGNQNVYSDPPPLVDAPVNLPSDEPKQQYPINSSIQGIFPPGMSIPLPPGMNLNLPPELANSIANLAASSLGLPANFLASLPSLPNFIPQGFNPQALFPNFFGNSAPPQPPMSEPILPQPPSFFFNLIFS